MRAPLRAGASPARPVREQVELRCAVVEACPPVRPYLLRPRRGEEPMLLFGVLHEAGRGAEARLAPVDRGAIELGQLLEEDDHGPEIDDGMMSCDQQPIAVPATMEDR